MQQNNLTPEQYKPLPDWNDAPAWANWRAVDANGYMFYYEFEPTLFTTMWNDDCKVYFASEDHDASNWRESLEARPEKIEDLKPCPICGKPVQLHEEKSPDETITWGRIGHGPTIACGISFLEEKNIVIEKWNNRVFL